MSNNSKNSYIYKDNLDSKKNQALLVLCYCIVLTLSFNYFFLITTFGTQMRNFFIISIITSLIFVQLFKKKVQTIKILKVSCIIFFLLASIYILYKIFLKVHSQKFNTLPNIIAAISIFVFLYIIYTFTDFNLIDE